MCSELFTSINRGLSGAGNKENILRTTDRNNFIGKLIKPMDQSAVDLLYCPAYYVDSDDPVFMISQAVILTALYEPFTVYNIASACLVATYLLAKNGYGYCRISKYSYDYIKDAMSRGDPGSATEHLRDVCFTKIIFKEWIVLCRIVILLTGFWWQGLSQVSLQYQFTLLMLIYLHRKSVCYS